MRQRVEGTMYLRYFNFFPIVQLWKYTDEFGN